MGEAFIDYFFVKKSKLFLVFIFFININNQILCMEQKFPITKFYDGNSPLHCIILFGTPDMLLRALPNTKNINITNKFGQTALHLACKKDNPLAARILLEHQADPNLPDKNGKTPVFISAESDFEPIAKLLIDFKADINIGDNSGNTPLHIAAKKEHINIAKLLIKNQVDINLKNSNHKTPLDLLIRKVLDNNNNQTVFFSENGLPLAKVLLDLGAKSSEYQTDYLKLLAQEKEKNISKNFDDGYFDACEII